jgi:nicotinate-nucleotide adenylyltransferase
VSTRRIGILGGTFDPFHKGHLLPMLEMREKLGWREIVFVPARVQPFKHDRSTASAFHRFAMTVVGCEEIDGTRVSPVELEREGVSYTVDTLEQLKEWWPDDALEWVIGDDNLARLAEWRELDRIFEMANFVVLRRKRGVAEVSAPLRDRLRSIKGRARSGGIILVTNTNVPVSASEIRRRIRTAEPWEEMVPSRVARYIHHNDLYVE